MTLDLFSQVTMMATASVMEGEMVESSSPSDILFWMVSTTCKEKSERLTSLKESCLSLFLTRTLFSLADSLTHSLSQTTHTHIHSLSHSLFPTSFTSSTLDSPMHRKASIR